MQKLIITALALFILVGCNTSKSATNTNERERTPQQRTRGERPSIDEMFKTMDVNTDGKLSKSEVKGPLERDFSRVDSNGDGFITKAELENAPRPERRQGARQRNQ